MKKIRNAIYSIIIIFMVSASATFFNFGCGGGDKNATVAELTECKGKVSVNSTAASAGNKLKNDDIVEVEKNSYARIKYMKENYDFMLYCTEKNKKSSKCQIKSAKDGGKTFLMNLMGGLLTFFVPPEEKRDAKLQITADDAIISIHQTQGKVDNGDDTLTVALAEGKVSVAVNGNEIFVSAGEQLQLNKNKMEIPKVKPYDIYSKDEQPLYFKDGSGAQMFLNNK